MTWLQQQGVVVLHWPPQLPDMNPIEHVWSTIKQKLDTIRVTSKEMMRAEIQGIWQGIEPDYLQNLVDSMPRRIEALIASKGVATRY